MDLYDTSTHVVICNFLYLYILYVLLYTFMYVGLEPVTEQMID